MISSPKLTSCKTEFDVFMSGVTWKWPKRVGLVESLLDCALNYERSSELRLCSCKSGRSEWEKGELLVVTDWILSNLSSEGCRKSSLGKKRKLPNVLENFCSFFSVSTAHWEYSQDLQRKEAFALSAATAYRIFRLCWFISLVLIILPRQKICV